MSKDKDYPLTEEEYKNKGKKDKPKIDPDKKNSKEKKK